MKKYLIINIFFSLLFLSVNSTEAAAVKTCQGGGGVKYGNFCFYPNCGNMHTGVMGSVVSPSYACGTIGQVWNGRACVSPPPPPPPVNGSCSTTEYKCSSGGPNNGGVNGDYWTWTCDGSSGGSTASCSKEICAGSGSWNGTFCGCPVGQTYNGYGCVSIPPPTNFNGSCSADGKTATFTWTNAPGYNTSYFRALQVGIPGDQYSRYTVLDNNTTGTSKSFAVTPGVTYNIWMHTRVPSTGEYSEAVSSTITCNIDQCNNIDGLQTAPPAGTTRNNTTGQCSCANGVNNPPACNSNTCASSTQAFYNNQCNADACTNISGTQTIGSLPTNIQYDGNGQCSCNNGANNPNSGCNTCTLPKVWNQTTRSCFNQYTGSGLIDIFNPKTNSRLINKGSRCEIDWNIRQEAIDFFGSINCTVNPGNIIQNNISKTGFFSSPILQNTTNYTLSCVGVKDGVTTTDTKNATCNVSPGVSEI